MIWLYRLCLYTTTVSWLCEVKTLLERKKAFFPADLPNWTEKGIYSWNTYYGVVTWDTDTYEVSKMRPLPLPPHPLLCSFFHGHVLSIKFSWDDHFHSHILFFPSLPCHTMWVPKKFCVKNASTKRLPPVQLFLSILSEHIWESEQSMAHILWKVSNQNADFSIVY